MSGSFASLLSLRQIPPGRIVFGAKETRELLPEDAPEKLKVRVSETVAANQQAFRIRRRFEKQQAAGNARGEAVAVRRLIRETVTAIFDIAKGHSTGLDEDHPEAVIAREVMDTAFPAGVGPIVMAPFEVQVATIDDLLAMFAEDGALHVHAVAMQLAARLDRLEGLNRRLETELGTTGPRISRDEVEDAFKQGQHTLHRLFVNLLAHYDGDTDEEVRERSRLLGPILFQDEKVRDLNRRSRRVPDIDPDSGEEQEAPPEGEQDEPLVQPDATTEGKGIGQ